MMPHGFMPNLQGYHFMGVFRLSQSNLSSLVPFLDLRLSQLYLPSHTHSDRIFGLSEQVFSYQ